MNNQTLKVLAVFGGTVIGVGLFGLPYVALKSGFLVTVLYFALLVPVVFIIHMLLGTVACGTAKTARIPGYAGMYLGARAKGISFIASILSLLGALLAYLIVGGRFLFQLLSPFLGGSSLLYTMIFFAAGALFIYRGIKGIAEIELALLVVFIVLLILFLHLSLPMIELNSLPLVGEMSEFVLPYGVILFSLAGTSIIPELKEMLKGDENKLRRVILTGSILIASAYILFIVIILGTTGHLTSEEALSGFARVVGQGVVYPGYLFGIITTFTSFLTLGFTLKKILVFDFRVPDRVSWFLACFTPLFMFLAGFNNFIDIIGITGAVMFGIEGMMILLIYRAYRRRLGFSLPWYIYGVMGVLILGVIFETAIS